MKFNKADTVKMGGTAVLTALIVLALHRPSPSLEPYTFSLATSTSQRISWAYAVNLENQYLAFKPLLVKFGDSAYPLKALVFNARQLDTIINHNLNPNGRDSTADDVFICFGQDSTSQNGSTRFGNIHLIAVGGKYDSTQGADTLMIKSNNINSPMVASVYDKAQPCPPTCPKTPQ
jgi:hypothetical protein